MMERKYVPFVWAKYIGGGEELVQVWLVDLDRRIQYRMWQRFWCPSNRRSPRCALLDGLPYTNRKHAPAKVKTCLNSVNVQYCIMKDFSRNYWRSNLLVAYSTILTQRLLQHVTMCQKIKSVSCLFNYTDPAFTATCIDVSEDQIC